MVANDNQLAVSVALLFQIDFLIWWKSSCVKEVELPKYWGTNRSKCITEEAEFQVGLEFEDKVSKACFPPPYPLRN